MSNQKDLLSFSIKTLSIYTQTKKLNDIIKSLITLLSLCSVNTESLRKCLK